MSFKIEFRILIKTDGKESKLETPADFDSYYFLEIEINQFNTM